MALQLEAFKFVDQKTKDLVSGYIKQFENEYKNQTDKELLVPSLVVTTCILFYYLGEFFKHCGQAMSIDDTLTVLTIEYKGTDDIYDLQRNSAFGNVIIDDKYPCLYSWKIQILKCDFFDIFIGICDFNENYLKVGYIYESDTCHALSSDGEKFSGVSHEIVRTQESWSINQIITMNVNTVNKTIEFYIDTAPKPNVTFENINFKETEYQLAVSMCSNGGKNSVKLLQFQQTSLM